MLIFQANCEGDLNPCSSPSSGARPKTRSISDVWLIGPVNSTIPQHSRLPSLREVLSVFFYFHNDQRLTLSESAKSTADIVLHIWSKAAIPTSHRSDIIKRILKVHAEWQCLKKAKNRRTETQCQKENNFSSCLDNLYDVAHADVKRLIKNEEDMAFLESQREGRKGYMAGEDKKWSERMERKRLREEAKDRYRQRSNQENSAINDRSGLESSSTESDIDVDTDTDMCHLMQMPTDKAGKRKKFMTTDVCSALDRTKVSDRQAVHLIGATAVALGHDIKEVTLSRSTVHRARVTSRAETAVQVRRQFLSDSAGTPLVVHWDGKLLPDTTGNEKVDRLPVIVTGNQIEQLLGVPKLPSGTGEAQANAVLRCLDDWDISSRIKGMSFDTTASNTGRRNGACILIEQALNTDLLYLACRHHIFEIVAEKVFTALKITTSSGPDIAIFQRFKDRWQWIDLTAYETASEMSEIASFKDSSLEFCQKCLETQQPRDDYREMLELCVIFLGGTPERGIHFIAPGALHRARWMARIIYSFKIWFFRRQFKLTVSEEKGIFQFLLFIARVYIHAWFEAPLPSAAPRNDLHFLNSLTSLSNQTVRTAASDAFGRHLWYLSEVNIAMAFFDNRISAEEKQLMIHNMSNNTGSEDPAHRVDIKLVNIGSSDLHSFVTTKTATFFHILGLPESFLRISPELWETDAEYQQAKTIVDSLKVVNDSAERGVKLMQDFNSIITNDEDQKQFHLHTVNAHRRQFPDSSRKYLDHLGHDSNN